MTHRCLTGGASGGTSVWYADRGGLNGLGLKSSWQYATCRKIRVDDTQVYTAGDRCLDPFQRSGDPEVYYKSCYILRDVLVGRPSSYTLYMDSSASASFRLTVTLRDSSGTTVGSGDTLPILPSATATDVLNAIEVACDSADNTTFVPSGAFTVTGGPLPGLPIVISPAGTYAGTFSTIEFPPDPEVQQIASVYRNSVEAWDKSDGTNIWYISLNNSATQLHVEGSTLFVAQHIYGYFTDCGPVFCYPAYYFDSSGNLTCWDGDLAGVGPNKTIAPDPVGGYSLIRVGTGYGTGAFAGPVPWNMTASELATAFSAAGVSATCSGGPLPGTPISVTVGGHAASYCVTSDTLIGPFEAGVALRLLSTTDGSELAQCSWGQPLWGQLNGQVDVTSIAKHGSTIYISGSDTGGVPVYATGPTFCRADGVNTRKFDTSLNPLGDLDGAIGSDSAWSVCFDSSGNCYSASDVGVLKIGSDFQTGGLAFNVSGTHLNPAGSVALLSDSVLVATWRNQLGTFNTSDGSNIANTVLPGVPDGGGGPGNGQFAEVCVDSNGFIYVAVGGRESGFTALPGCVFCYDSSLSLQWRYDHVNSDGTILGQVLTVACEADGSFVYFGGTRIPVGPRP